MLSAVSSLLGKRDASSEPMPPMHFNMGVDDDDEDEQELKAKKMRLALDLKHLEAVETRCSQDLEQPAGFDLERWGFLTTFEEQQREVQPLTLMEWDALSKRIRDRIVYFNTKKAIVKKKLAQKRNFAKIEGLRNQAKKQRKSVVGVRDSILEINSQEL
jgi:hypothetical protein